MNKPSEIVSLVPGFYPRLEQPKPYGAPIALSALTDLVEIYEAVHVAIPPITGVGALRYLMAENDLSQADLVPIFGTPSVISEVLSGKRGLALAHVKKLAARFGVPTDVFIQ